MRVRISGAGHSMDKCSFIKAIEYSNINIWFIRRSGQERWEEGERGRERFFFSASNEICANNDLYRGHSPLMHTGMESRLDRWNYSDDIQGKDPWSSSSFSFFCFSSSSRFCFLYFALLFLNHTWKRKHTHTIESNRMGQDILLQTPGRWYPKLIRL